MTIPAIANAVASSSVDSITANDRVIPVTRWRARDRRGAILFSHGAFSAPWKYELLIQPWVAAGYDVWAPLHVDSTDHPETKSYPGLASWPARIEDMQALSRHVGAPSWVAAGHSYGALVALTLGGATPAPLPGISRPIANPLVSCVIAFSPPGPDLLPADAAGYASLAVPALIQTGTHDIPSGGTDLDEWHTHLIAYESPEPGGDRYALVLDGADHFFGGLICSPELPGPGQTAQLEQSIAYSKLFLRGYAEGDAAARHGLAAQAHHEPPLSPGFYYR